MAAVEVYRLAFAFVLVFEHGTHCRLSKYE